MRDLALNPAHIGKFRKDWGMQNIMGMEAPKNPITMKNDFRQRRVNEKIEGFLKTGVHPQQLTVPRQYATTREGTFIYKILTGREIPWEGGSKYREKGVRVVVQENLKQARFVISPLFDSEHDAQSWARQQMGAKT